jgi:hypothetical protein
MVLYVDLDLLVLNLIKDIHGELQVTTLDCRIHAATFPASLPMSPISSTRPDNRKVARAGSLLRHCFQRDKTLHSRHFAARQPLPANGRQMPIQQLTIRIPYLLSDFQGMLTRRKSIIREERK